jgi:hypothetical protein
MKPWAKKFYKSAQWQDCRDSYIAERKATDGGLCEVCHDQPGYIVHHKIMLTPGNIDNPDIALNWGNLSYECKACHDLHEGHGVLNVTPACCAFDIEGNPVARLHSPLKNW